MEHPRHYEGNQGNAHLSNNGEVLVDRKTHYLFLPLRDAKSDTEPLYLVNVRTSSTFTHVLLGPWN